MAVILPTTTFSISVDMFSIFSKIIPFIVNLWASSSGDISISTYSFNKL